MSIKKFAFPATLAGIVGLLVVLFIITNKPAAPTPNLVAKHWADNLVDLQTGPAPWQANNAADSLKARLTAIGLPALTAEGEVLHIHQHLDVFVNGQKLEIPADIGIASGFISPVHVHDTGGVIHIESPTKQDFFLGQLFAVWGVNLDVNLIGGYKADDTNKLHVYVNGQLYSGNPRDLKLEAHQEIAVTFGTDSQLPNPIPSSFTFPTGE